METRYLVHSSVRKPVSLVKVKFRVSLYCYSPANVIFVRKNIFLSKIFDFRVNFDKLVPGVQKVSEQNRTE